jgi:predicted dehydrogenase
LTSSWRRCDSERGRAEAQLSNREEKVFKVAIVGCGLISNEKYLPILRGLNDRVAIVGLCDLNEDILRKAATKFGVPNAYTNFSEMLSEQMPDLVIICTPPRTHAGLAVNAMQEGAHVLVEKPMATSTAECDSMVDASMRFGKKLGVMHNQIFNPAVEQARHIVSTDRFGRFLGMRVFLVTAVDYMTSNPDHWAHKLPGGVIGETGPHAVYLSLAFLKNVRDVQVRYKKLLTEYPWSIGEDIRIDLIADNGMSSITLAYGSIQTTADVDIIGTKGLLKLDLQSRTLIEHKRPDLTAGIVGKSVLSTTYQMAKALILNSARYALSRSLDPHYRGINKFLDYLSNGTDYPATGEDGRQVVAVMEMIVQKTAEQARN